MYGLIETEYFGWNDDKQEFFSCGQCFLNPNDIGSVQQFEPDSKWSRATDEPFFKVKVSDVIFVVNQKGKEDIIKSLGIINKGD